MNNMYKYFLEKIYNSYNKKTFKKEDGVVLNFLNKLQYTNNRLYYLEVGSGLCRFPMIIKNQYQNFDLRCIEKNQFLVEIGIRNNLNVVSGDITKTDFKDKEFDIIHCSHVIEHLDYQSITATLDEMLRILKIGGYLIIRSPLMYPGFYFDIDHARPYPPESILNFFNNQQQQKVGSYKISEISRWYRKEAFLFYNSNNLVAKFFNIFFRLSWLAIGFPRSKSNGYILILKKI